MNQPYVAQEVARLAAAIAVLNDRLAALEKRLGSSLPTEDHSTDQVTCLVRRDPVYLSFASP